MNATIEASVSNCERSPVRRIAAQRHVVGAIAVIVLAVAALLAVAQSHAQRVAPCTGGPTFVNVVAPLLPRAFVPETVQPGADCIAWQEFIYLNWQANPARPGRPATAPASSFGTPGDVTPTVWQTYPLASTVFDPPARASRAAGQGLLQLRSTLQAGGGWLTSQSGSPTYYEVRLNQDEADYIRDNDLATFAGQAACVRGKGGFNLPHGSSAVAGRDTDCGGSPRTYGQDIGAIELKAAWIVLPADGSLDYRYKTSRAIVTNPASGKASEATVGLVGLHIMRKLPGASQFLWATFEQVDNTPDDATLARPVSPANAPARLLERGFTYFNAACAPAADPYGCARNTLPGAPCEPGRPAAPPGCHPQSVPTQATRLTPVPKETNDATAEAWGAIQRQRAPGSPASVFNYYRLIDVQWPAEDIPPVPPRAAIPLPTRNMIPTDDTRYVANTTMETFVQRERSCLDCHQNAAIARQVTPRATPLTGRAIQAVLRGTASPLAAGRFFAADYSFVFAAETRR